MEMSDMVRMILELAEEQREDNTVDNHCPVCGEYESECECEED